MNTLLTVGLTIGLGFAGGKLIYRLKLPVVTGYVLVGVVLGASLLNVLPSDAIERAGLMSDLALGVIAFTIGGELKLSTIKKLGRSILYIVLLEAFGAFALVAGVMYLMTHTVYMALILGAVAAATAPAATVTVLQQDRARGVLTTTILAVVGIDDGIALVIYGFASSLAKTLLASGEELSVIGIVLRPLLEILGAIALGVAAGAVMSYLARRMRDQAQLLTLAASALLICSGIAVKLHLSELLTGMALAMTFVNLSASYRSNQILDALRLIGFPIIAGFFCLAGTRLNVGLIPKIGLIGLLYTGARMAGKYGGATLGAHLSRAPEVVRRYVGFSLWPQIGVAVALAIIVEKEFVKYGTQGRELSMLVINVLLFTTLITEIIGPAMTRWAIRRAGEADVSEAGKRREP